MKKLALAAFAVAVCAFAERNVGIHENMEITEKATKVLRGMERKTGPQAVRAAEQMAVMYEEMIPFWRGRGSTIGIKTSEAGKNLAVQLVAAASADNAAAADSAFKELMGTCKSCHDVHRERGTDGQFRTK